MRITVNVPDKLGEATKTMASNERVSVSRIAQRALEFYLTELTRKRLGHAVLDLAGRTRVADDATELLEKGRADDRS